MSKHAQIIYKAYKDDIIARALQSTITISSILMLTKVIAFAADVTITKCILSFKVVPMVMGVKFFSLYPFLRVTVQTAPTIEYFLISCLTIILVVYLSCFLITRKRFSGNRAIRIIAISTMVSILKRKKKNRIINSIALLFLTTGTCLIIVDLFIIHLKSLILIGALLSYFALWLRFYAPISKTSLK